MIHARNSFNVVLHRIERGDPAPQIVPELRRGCRLTNSLREVSRVPDAEVQTVAPVGDLLCHSADGAAQDWLAVRERLLNDQGRILPPDGRDNDPIYISHKARQVPVYVPPHQRDILFCRLQQ